MTYLELLTTCFPDLQVSQELVRAQSQGWGDQAVESCADGYVAMADVHELSTPNTYRSTT